MRLEETVFWDTFKRIAKDLSLKGDKLYLVNFTPTIDGTNYPSQFYTAKSLEEVIAKARETLSDTDVSQVQDAERNKLWSLGDNSN